MTRHEIVARYKGSFLGLLWSFITPVMMLAMYTFVFSFVLKARWGQSQGDQYEFAMILFTGLIAFNLFSDCLARCPTIIMGNINYVKKVIFPLEILPLIILGSALFNATISFIVLFSLLKILGHPFSLTMLWLPVVMFPFILLTLGLSWFLASLGVFIRDISQFIGMLLTVSMFMCPIFYPLSALPDDIQAYIFFNPLTVIVEQLRRILIFEQQPDWGLMSIYSVIAIVICYLGFIWFQKTRKGFADVM